MSMNMNIILNFKVKAARLTSCNVLKMLREDRWQQKVTPARTVKENFIMRRRLSLSNIHFVTNIVKAYTIKTNNLWSG